MPRACIALIAAVLLPACAGTTQVQRAGSDQEITREIMFRYREEARFEGVYVKCVDRVVTLEGRVDDRLAHEEAVRIARDLGRGSQVVSQIVVRPR